MKLHNTLTRQIDDFKPIQDGQVAMYSCGPTVYDHIHIGNLSSFIFADTLRRTLLAKGLKVNHVVNYTDVDDKTIKRSQEKYPEVEPLEALTKLTGKCIDVFLADIKAVGMDVDAIDFVKATDSIGDMQKLIAQLHKDGFAYIADDGVYFSIEAYKKSGKTYGQLTEITSSSTSEARIQNDEYDKESVHDFALWKLQKPNEPAWDFELDGKDLKGRPGWHIECSAMSSTALGQPFDIHTGGVDLIFPHHENEIAQSTAGQDSNYANYFAHNEHLLVDGQKMSKSLNNFHTLKAITDKDFDPLAFRLLVLQAHYRKQAHFSWENLEAAQNRLKIYRQFADLLWQLPEESQGPNNEFDVTKQAIQAALADDLDTPKALAALSQLESQSVRVLVEGKNSFKPFLEYLDAVFGLQLSVRPDITNEQYGLIDDREKARAGKAWAKADTIRDQLLEQGVGLRDENSSTIWYRL